MTLTYDDATLNGNAEGDLQIVYSITNNPIVWLTTSGSMINMATNALSQTFNNINIASVSASSDNIVLALELIRFEARKSNNEEFAILNWTMSSVENMLEFSIEKSDNAHDFYLLANVAISQMLKYEVLDKEPLNGRNLYRLKMVDKLNQTTYSEIRALNFGKFKSEVNLYPNPTQTTFTVHTKDATLINTAATVLDLNGKIIKRFILNAESTTISAQDWAAGMYLIKLNNGQTFKLDKR